MKKFSFLFIVLQFCHICYNPLLATHPSYYTEEEINTLYRGITHYEQGQFTSLSMDKLNIFKNQTSLFLDVLMEVMKTEKNTATSKDITLFAWTRPVKDDVDVFEFDE